MNMSKVIQLKKLKPKTDRASGAEVLRTLLPTVEHYRSQGNSLNDIFSALVEEGFWTMSFTTFKCYYYSERSKDKEPLSRQTVGQSGKVQNNPIRRSNVKKEVSSNASNLSEPTLEKVDIDTVGAGHVIIDIEFEKKPSTAVVEELLPTIEHYRSKGQTLPKIYAALCKKNLLSTDASSHLTWSVFRNVYYQLRKEASTDSQLEQSKHNGVEKEKEIESAETNVKKRRRRSIVKGSKAG